MKMMSAIFIYLACTLLNPTFAASKQMVQFTGSFYYGVSDKYSILAIKQVPSTFNISEKEASRVYTLTI